LLSGTWGDSLSPVLHPVSQQRGRRPGSLPPASRLLKRPSFQGLRLLPPASRPLPERRRRRSPSGGLFGRGHGTGRRPASSSAQSAGESRPSHLRMAHLDASLPALPSRRATRHSAEQGPSLTQIDGSRVRSIASSVGFILIADARMSSVDLDRLLLPRSAPQPGPAPRADPRVRSRAATVIPGPAPSGTRDEGAHRGAFGYGVAITLCGPERPRPAARARRQDRS